MPLTAQATRQRAASLWSTFGSKQNRPWDLRAAVRTAEGCPPPRSKVASVRRCWANSVTVRTDTRCRCDAPPLVRSTTWRSPLSFYMLRPRWTRARRVGWILHVPRSRSHRSGVRHGSVQCSSQQGCACTGIRRSHAATHGIKKRNARRQRITRSSRNSGTAAAPQEAPYPLMVWV